MGTWPILQPDLCYLAAQSHQGASTVLIKALLCHIEGTVHVARNKVIGVRNAFFVTCRGLRDDVWEPGGNAAGLGHVSKRKRLLRFVQDNNRVQCMELLLLRPGLRWPTQGHLRAEEHDQCLLPQVPLAAPLAAYIRVAPKQALPISAQRGPIGAAKALQWWRAGHNCSAVLALHLVNGVFDPCRRNRYGAPGNTGDSSTQVAS